ncbi:MAG: hypothetical protein OEY38_17860, partial [Gammaproteobacteria bacterium]|nr:hypothetical protein [Gammaproteobacteria bacterium]
KQTQTTGVDTSTVSPSKVHTVSIKIVSEENGFITFSMDELAIEDGKISQGDKLVFDFSAVEGLSLSKQLSVFCIGQEKGQYLFRSAVAEPNENELQQIKMLKHLPDVNVNVSRSGTVGTAKTTGFDSAFIGELMLRILLSHQGLRVTEERQKLAKILDQIRGRATAIADLAALKQFLKPFCATGEPFNVSNLFYETSEEQALDFDEAQWLDILGLIFSIYVSQAKFSVQAHSSGAIDCCQKISQALQAQLAVLTTQASTVVVEEPQSKLADLADVKSILMSIFDDENWVSQSLAFVNGESPKRVPSAKPAVSTPTNEHLPDQSFIQNLKNNAQTAVSTSTPDLDATVILDASMREQLSSPEANRSSPAAAVNELEETVILSKEDMQNTVSRLRNAVPTQSSKPHSPALDETMIISPDMLPKEKI